MDDLTHEMSIADRCRVRLRDKIWLVPQHMHLGVAHFFEEGREVGDFLTAMLEGRFRDARDRMDGINARHWPGWERFLKEGLPTACHGSPAKATRWRAHNGLSGLPVSRYGELET